MRQIEILRKLYRGRHKSNVTALQIDSALLKTDTTKELKETGIAIIENFLDSQAISAIKNKIDDLLNEVTHEEWNQILEKVKLPENRFGIRTNKDCLFWTDKQFSDQRIIHSEKMMHEINAFAQNEFLISIGSWYLQKNLELKFCMANRTRYSESNAGSGGGWHRDQNYKRGFKALLYLVDTDTSNGCFQYLKKSISIYHHLLKTPTPDKYQFTHEEVLKMIGGNENEITNATAKAGTVVIFDTNGIHRGRPIEPGGERYALTNYYLD